MSAILDKLEAVATHPYEHVRAWKKLHGKPVIGTLPMHCPAELIHAAGALPVQLQELPDAITSGGGAMFNFFCAFTRSIVDQATEDKLDFLDAIIFVDHCMQLLSAADVMRVSKPQLKIHFHQLTASMEEKWAFDNILQTLRSFVGDLEETLSVSIGEDDLRNSTRIFNENRSLIRRLYELRRSGAIDLPASSMQHVVKSSMVMDRSEHSALLRQLIGELQAQGGRRREALPLYVSGHLCHAARPEILDLIEDCGFRIVDDDLYHGYRYVSTDVEVGVGDPIVELAKAYLRKNGNVPCPTRIAPATDWDSWLVKRVPASGASALVVLLAKFCEPHYFHYPHIRAAFDAADIPHLMVETEHEGVPMENLRTKVESFAELIRRRETSRRTVRA